MPAAQTRALNQITSPLARRGDRSGGTHLEAGRGQEVPVVHGGLQSPTVAQRLAAATYRDALAAGIRFGFLDCEPSLAPMYERLGYRALRALHDRLADADEGVVMVHDLQDEGQLRRVRSPLLKHLLGWKREAQPA